MTTADITASVNGETVDQLSIAWGESVDINFSIPSGVDVNPGVFIYYLNYPHSTFNTAMRFLSMQTLMV